MKKEKRIVLVTGTSGRIGSVVMQRLGRRFTDVIGFDCKVPSPPHRAATARWRGFAVIGLERRPQRDALDCSGAAARVDQQLRRKLGPLHQIAQSAMRF